MDPAEFDRALKTLLHEYRRKTLLFNMNHQSDMITGITRLLKRCGDQREDYINRVDISGWAVLHHIAHLGRPDIIKLLITSGADVNTVTEQCHQQCEYCTDKLSELPSGLTALHVACATGNDDMVSVLLESDACVNARDSAGWQPLHYSVRESRSPETLSILLKHGADVMGNIQHQWIKLNVIHLLLSPAGPAREADVSSTMTLLDMLIAACPEEKLSEVDSEGRSPLHLAVETGNIRAVELLCLAEPQQIAYLNQEVDINGFSAVQKAPLITLFYQLQHAAYLPSSGYVRIRNCLMTKVDVTQAFYSCVALVTAGNYHMLNLAIKFLEQPMRFINVVNPFGILFELDPCIIRKVFPNVQHFPPLRIQCLKIVRHHLFRCLNNISIITYLPMLNLPIFVQDQFIPRDLVEFMKCL